MSTSRDVSALSLSLSQYEATCLAELLDDCPLGNVALQSIRDRLYSSARACGSSLDVEREAQTALRTHTHGGNGSFDNIESNKYGEPYSIEDETGSAVDGSSGAVSGAPASHIGFHLSIYL